MTLRLITGGQASPTAFPPFDSILDRTARRQLEGLVTFVEVGRGFVLAREGEVRGDFLVVSEGIVFQ